MTPGRLHLLLTEHGLNQTEAARLCGVEPRTVRRWLAGDRPIPHWIDRLFWLIDLARSKKATDARQMLKTLE